MTHVQAERGIVYEATWPADWRVDRSSPSIPWADGLETLALADLIHETTAARWRIESLARARWDRRRCRVEDPGGRVHEIAPDLGPGVGRAFGSKFGATARVVS